MRVDTGNGTNQPKRIALDAATLDEARAQLEEKRTANRKGQLHAPGRRPTFAALVEQYFASAEYASKRPRSQQRERLGLAKWVAEIGGLRCDWIKPGHLTAFRDRRRAQKVRPQTINLDLIPVTNVMRYAVDRGWIADVPRLKRLKPQPPAKRALLTPDEIVRLLEHCRPDVIQNAALMSYFIRFLALTGARKGEATRVRWLDVDFGKRLATIGAAGDAKGGGHRAVNFTAELAALLCEMRANRQPDSSYLFPSPHRGQRDVPVRAIRGAFSAVRKAAGLPRVTLHDFRHFFTSQAVMQGTDYMTVASWLGHRDGGILVGKVYGHLADGHKVRMAANLTLLAPPRPGKLGAAAPLLPAKSLPEIPLPV